MEYNSKDLTSVLSYIKNNFGIEAFKNKRVVYLMSDLAPGLSRDRKMIAKLVDTKIMDQFIDAHFKDSAKKKEVAQKAVFTLVDEEFVEEETARKYVKTLTRAFGWKTRKIKPKDGETSSKKPSPDKPKVEPNKPLSGPKKPKNPGHVNPPLVYRDPVKPPGPTKPKTGPLPKTKICPNCRKIIPADAKYCPKCRRILEPRKKTGSRVTMLIFVILLCCFFGFLYGLFSDPYLMEVKTVNPPVVVAEMTEESPQNFSSGRILNLTSTETFELTKTG